MRENVEAKADRLLTTGAVTVIEVRSDSGGARARVAGDHDRYNVTFDGRWRCSCPSFGPCSHGIAAAKVVHR
jgi:hypothetical protein